MKRFAILLASACLCTGASAATFHFEYSIGTPGVDEVLVTASGTLFTTDTTTLVDGREAYAITGITGQRNGSTIDELLPVGGAVDEYGDAADNYLFANPTYFSFNGFAFGTADNSLLYNIYYDGSVENGNPIYREFISDASTSPPTGMTSSGLNSFTITRESSAVPEPSSWALMLGGFGLIGNAMRSRRKVAVSFV